MRVATTLILTMLSAAVAADKVAPVEEVESYVNIRSAPDASAKAISRLHKSKPREHVKTLDGWYEVALDDGATGFVSSDWSVLLKDDGSGPAAEADEEAAQEAVPTPQAVAGQIEAAEPTAPIQNEAPPEPTPATVETARVEDVVEPPAPAIVENKSAEPPEVEAPAEEMPSANTVADAVVSSAAAEAPAPSGTAGPRGPQGPAGPPGPPGKGAIEGT